MDLIYERPIGDVVSNGGVRGLAAGKIQRRTVDLPL